MRRAQAQGVFLAAQTQAGPAAGGGYQIDLSQVRLSALATSPNENPLTHKHAHTAESTRYSAVPDPYTCPTSQSRNTSPLGGPLGVRPGPEGGGGAGHRKPLCTTQGRKAQASEP